LLIEVILVAGRAAIELSLFVLWPMMVVMLTIMRLLEARGVLDCMVARLAPLLRPLGLTGLGVFAALQISFVSFAAPMATLSMMDQGGTSNRHLAATFAMVLAMAQANVTLPMLSMGLAFGPVLGLSFLGGMAAAAATYYGFGRHLDMDEQIQGDTLRHPSADSPKNILDIISRAGAEALRIAIGAVPLLVISLVAMSLLQRLGAVDGLARLLGPLLGTFNISPVLILPTLTKYLAGGTAMMGVMDDLHRHGLADGTLINHSAGLLIHPLDLPGVAILVSAGRRVAAIWKPAVGGALVGIALRSAGQICFS